MDIADIFEALTARDRPCSQDMKLSRAMNFLAKSNENGQIEPDLFDVFIKQGVYRDCAEQFLDPAQIDAVYVGALAG